MKTITQEEVMDYVNDNPGCSCREVCIAFIENFEDLNTAIKGDYITKVGKRLTSLSKSKMVKRKSFNTPGKPYYQYWVNY